MSSHQHYKYLDIDTLNLVPVTRYIYVVMRGRLKARFMIATVFSHYVAKTGLLVKIITR